jgi:hypothetical protein
MWNELYCMILEELVESGMNKKQHSVVDGRLSGSKIPIIQHNVLNLQIAPAENSPLSGGAVAPKGTHPWSHPRMIMGDSNILM